MPSERGSSTVGLESSTSLQVVPSALSHRPTTSSANLSPPGAAPQLLSQADFQPGGEQQENAAALVPGLPVHGTAPPSTARDCGFILCSAFPSLSSSSATCVR